MTDDLTAVRERLEREAEWLWLLSRATTTSEKQRPKRRQLARDIDAILASEAALRAKFDACMAGGPDQRPPRPASAPEATQSASRRRSECRSRSSTAVAEQPNP